jgi:sirohydrochlorin cobaltochelatase
MSSNMNLTMTQSIPAGIVLFAHGSRDPLWRQPMDAVAGRIRQIEPGARVVCAFLELTTPDLATAVEELVRQGARRITVVPMFLGVGRHAREDLPVLMAGLRARHPDVEYLLQPAVGEDDRLTDLLARMALTSWT